MNTEQIYAKALAMCSADENEALTIYIERIHADYSDEHAADIYEAFCECYVGKIDRYEFAANIFTEIYGENIPSRYIDLEAFECDLFIDSYTEEEGYIYRNI